jgi:hypothetical protein
MPHPQRKVNMNILNKSRGLLFTLIYKKKDHDGINYFFNWPVQIKKTSSSRIVVAVACWLFHWPKGHFSFIILHVLR